LETNESAECPLCLERMQPEDRAGSTWMICPNGCPTELEVALAKPPSAEIHPVAPVLLARAGGSRTWELWLPDV